MERRNVARWGSKGGKRFGQLYHQLDVGYSYVGDGCSGYIGRLADDATAIAWMEAHYVYFAKMDFPSYRRIN